MFNIEVRANDLKHHKVKVRMPSKKQYDLVTEDGADSLIPVHSEEAFKLGVTFEVKVSVLLISLLIASFREKKFL